jgi:hypothetical protein
LGLATDRFDVVSLLTGRTLPLVENPNASMEMPRVLSQAFMGRMRGARRGTIPDTLGANWAAVGTALWEMQALDQVIAGAKPPLNWHSFVRSVISVDQFLHGGAAGVVDEAWYAGVRGFAAKMQGPAGALASLDLLHGLGTYNFVEAAQAVAVLEREGNVGRAWVAPEMLRNGGAVARLRTDDVDGAERLLFKVTPSIKGGREDLRTLLLEAYMRQYREAHGGAPRRTP